MTCTFFGHRNTSESIAPTLWKTLVELVENHNVDLFYVGNHGHFDSIVLKALKKLKALYPHISYYIVLAYMPVEKMNYGVDFSYTIYPEGLESVPLRYAIDKRNRWMIDQSEIVVTYVVHEIGGASKFKRLAEKKNRNIIDLV